MSVITTTSFTSGGMVIPVDVHRPSTGTPDGRLAVVLHGSDGLVKPWAGMIRAFADSIADSQAIAIVPSYFGQAAPARPLPGLLADLPQFEKRLADAIAFGATIAGVNPKRTGLLGFSLGGHLALRLRKSAKGAIAFFAPELAEIGGIGAAPGVPLPFAQLHHPEEDAISGSIELYRRLKQERTKAELHTYIGATHGFAGPNDRMALEESKLLALDFLRTRL